MMRIQRLGKPGPLCVRRGKVWVEMTIMTLRRDRSGQTNAPCVASCSEALLVGGQRAVASGHAEAERDSRDSEA